MKYLLFVLLLSTFNCFAQENFKYSAGIAGGWLTTIAERGPKYVTEVGEVEFLHPMSAIGYVYFDVRLKENISMGIEAGLDQFDYGYSGRSMYSYSGLSSGSLTSADYIYLYKTGLRISYHLPLWKRFSLQGTLTPAIGYFARSGYLDDTACLNSYMHSVRPPGSNKIQYIHYPPQQKEGFHFTAKATAMFSYRVGKKLAITADIAYQQGFSMFHTDSVSIRQYEPGTLKRFEHVYYTKLNGTSFQFHFGLKYVFGNGKSIL
ncbi:MAG TPA: hypothetical protein VEB40_04865 [Flavipsychrobacter sp.]|nr:hypothetical protein [Flavipsychrobacter sp.]